MNRPHLLLRLIIASSVFRNELFADAQTCSFCGDEEAVLGTPKRVVYFQNESHLCEEMPALESSLQSDQADCDEFQRLGREKCYCGRTDSGCTLCEKNSNNVEGTLPEPAREVVPGLTCQDFELDARFLASADKCPAYQATVGLHCGCSNPLSLESDVCRICGEGNLLPFPGKLAVAADEQGTEAEVSEVSQSCMESELKVVVDLLENGNQANICTELQGRLGDSCCAQNKNACTLCFDQSDSSLPKVNIESVLQKRQPQIAKDDPDIKTCRNMEQSELLQDINAGSQSCDIIQRDIGFAQCGCAAPPNVCPMCYGGKGSAELNWNGRVSGEGGGTCLELNANASTVTPDSPQCTAYQVEAFRSCGCPNLPPTPQPTGNSTPCGLCPKQGQSPPNADGVLKDNRTSFFGMTCATADKLAPFLLNEDSTQCDLLREDAVGACGCYQECNLCSDGTPPLDPSGRFVMTGAGSVRTASAVTLTCDQVFQQQPFFLPPSNCSHLQRRGSDICLCGHKLTANDCNLCEDGSSLRNPLRAGLGNDACAALAVAAKRDLPEHCPIWQATVGSYCGCNNTKAQESACMLCMNKPLPYPRATVNINGRERTCGEVEYLANENNKEKCNDYRAIYFTSCCAGAFSDVSSAFGRGSPSLLWITASAMLGLLFVG